jgi:hypothetical protein
MLGKREIARERQAPALGDGAGQADQHGDRWPHGGGRKAPRRGQGPTPAAGVTMRTA